MIDLSLPDSNQIGWDSHKCTNNICNRRHSQCKSHGPACKRTFSHPCSFIHTAMLSTSSRPRLSPLYRCYSICQLVRCLKAMRTKKRIKKVANVDRFLLDTILLPTEPRSTHRLLFPSKCLVKPYGTGFARRIPMARFYIYV